MDNVQIFDNKKLGIRVRIIDNLDRNLSINAEDIAIGFGWFKTDIKGEKEYLSVCWERMNGYSKELGFDHE